MQSELMELQQAELVILKQVIAICEKHHLTYYAVGGTLLGAVRHHGFIPWDDDIDIVLPRPDYEAFLRIAPLELNDPFQLNTIKLNEKGRIYYYAKAENTSLLVKKYTTKMKMAVPVWIDIFPLDGAPDNDYEANKWIRRGNLFRNLLKLSQYSYRAGDDLSKKPLNAIVLMLRLEKLVNPKMAWNALNRVSQKYSYETSERVCNFCGRYGIREIVQKSVFGKGTLLSFESIEIKCPDDYDAYLTHIYGDYMTLPPSESRKDHKVKIVRDNL